MWRNDSVSNKDETVNVRHPWYLHALTRSSRALSSEALELSRCNPTRLESVSSGQANRRSHALYGSGWRTATHPPLVGGMMSQTRHQYSKQYRW